MSASDAWDGAAGWPRPRLVPLDGHGQSAMAAACFVQAVPADPLSVDPGRLRQVFANLDCQVCGEPTLSVDAVGWVLEPAANMGGACCTRCMYLAVRTCPHLARAPAGDFEFWPVREPRDYTWHVVDGTTKGHVVPDRTRPGAAAQTWTQFLAHYRAWKSASQVARTSAEPSTTPTSPSAMLPPR